VIAARDLDAVADTLRQALGLGEPYADPGVERFGLRNAVFALGDTFLEVVSPIRPDTAAGRQLDRRGGDCGYMLMFEVEDFEEARRRAHEEGIREVFGVSLPEMQEVHLHPADMRGAIVSLSSPHPPGSWIWGGPGWKQRAAPLRITGATIAASEPVTIGARWQAVLGRAPRKLGILVSADEIERGVTEIILSPNGERRLEPVDRPPLQIGGVRFVLATDKE
jgi:hypothetical protein